MLTWKNNFPWGWDLEAENPEWNGDPDDPRATGYWTESNTPYLSESKFMDKYLYKADYVRLKNVQLTYSFPKKITERINVGGLKVYVAGSNLYTWTEFDGWDPETGAESLPPLKTYILGINLQFR
jgi:hypothetical protein